MPGARAGAPGIAAAPLAPCYCGGQSAAEKRIDHEHALEQAGPAIHCTTAETRICAAVCTKRELDAAQRARVALCKQRSRCWWAHVPDFENATAHSVRGQLAAKLQHLCAGQQRYLHSRRTRVKMIRQLLTSSLEPQGVCTVRRTRFVGRAHALAATWLSAHGAGPRLSKHAHSRWHTREAGARRLAAVLCMGRAAGAVTRGPLRALAGPPRRQPLDKSP